jgi:aminotransferase
MKIREAGRATSIKFSPIRAAAQTVEDLARKGIRIIDLSIGRPDFDTPLHIKEAAKKALDEGKVHYTTNDGLIELRQAIGNKLHRENGLEYNPEEVIITTGAVEALAVALMAFIEPGDEVIIPEPGWVNYVSLVQLCGGTPVYVSLSDGEGFSFIPSRISEKISPKTKAMILATPNNPTGTVLTSGILADLAKVAIDHNLLVISDEVYEKIIYDGVKHVSIASHPHIKERTIICNALSKTYSMTGWRIGYLAADKELIPSLIKVHQSLVTCANSIGQWAAITAITGSQQSLEKMVTEFARRRSFLIEAFKMMSPLRLVVPSGAFYAFIDVRKMQMTSAAAVDFFIKNAGVAMVPGNGFGPSGEGYIRLSFASSLNVLKEATEKMQIALEKGA